MTTPRPLPEPAYEHLSPDELAAMHQHRAQTSRRAFRARSTRRPEDPLTAGLGLDAAGYEWG